MTLSDLNFTIDVKPGGTITRLRVDYTITNVDGFTKNVVADVSEVATSAVDSLKTALIAVVNEITAANG